MARETAAIRGRMAQISITQQELALAMGYERSAITRYLTGVRLCPANFVARVHLALDKIEEEKEAARDAVQKLRAERAAQEVPKRAAREEQERVLARSREGLMKDLVYTRKEAAARMKISLPLLDSWLRRPNRPIPNVRQGRKVLIPVAQLEEWIAQEAMQ